MQNSPPRAPTTSFISAVLLGVRSMIRYPWLAGTFLAATAVQGALQGLLVWTLRGTLITVRQSDTVAALIWGGLSIFAIWTLRAASSFTAEVVSVNLARRVEVESMWKVLAKLLRLSMRFYDRNSEGDFVMAAYQDLRGIRAVTQETGRLFLHTSRLAGLAVVAWALSPKLATIGLFTVPLAALPAYWFGQRITHAATRERGALTNLHNSFLQVSSGIRVIKVNRAESHVLADAHRIGSELCRQLARQVKLQNTARFLLDAVSGLGLIVVLTVGGREAAAGRLGWESLLAILVAVMAVYSPIIDLLQMYNVFRSVIPYLDRIDRIMKEPVTIEDRLGARRLVAAPARIDLNDVSFAYDERAVLQSVSMTVHRGERVGIVGASGAGKSTLMSLLLRLYDPTGGAILLDGVDLRDIRHADVMDLCALVPQEPFLFVDTVANNIRVTRADAPIDEVIAAAKAANIHDEIMAMEQGYDTVIGRAEGGRGISVGQKQRICIAAALLKNAPLLFLDEATSNLDAVSERLVQKAIDRLMEGRTTFVIAHRLSTLRDANRIMVLDAGRLVGFGSHQELLASCPTYATLWAQSARGGDTPVRGVGPAETAEAGPSRAAQRPESAPGRRIGPVVAETAAVPQG